MFSKYGRMYECDIGKPQYKKKCKSSDNVTRGLGGAGKISPKKFFPEKFYF